jgi:ABC-2 type transport system permease protein
MRRALSSELLKLRTTRTFFALTLSAVLLVAGISGLGAALGTWKHGVAPGEDLVGITTFGTLFALVLGVLAVSTEFRHGTITPTLLTVPSRGRVIAAKVVAHLLAGLVLGLLAVLLNLLLVGAILSLRGIDSGTSATEALRWIAGYGAAGALFAALGVGIGAIVRNQVGGRVAAAADPRGRRRRRDLRARRALGRHQWIREPFRRARPGAGRARARRLRAALRGGRRRAAAAARRDGVEPLST